jgi:DMSO/TMAO reductase YedYZ molybdopterin-dependent catalytic subunit
MTNLNRRTFIKIVGAAGLALLSGCQEAPDDQGAGPLSPTPTSGVPATPPPSPLDLIITPTGEFFVQAFSGFPQVAEADWSLRVFGLVEHPLELSYQDVLNLPKIEEVRTLECIGNPVGGSLVGNALWGGFEAKHLWEQAGILPGAVRGSFGAADGYFTSVDLEWLTQPGVLMAYEINGAPLPTEHGYPLRILMPGLYGQKMPKWITEIEFVDDKPLGYWERQGWSDVASVQTNSIIWQPKSLALHSAEAVPVYGMAFAGLRKIVAVEVRIDDGPWMPAELMENDSSLIWTQWSFSTPADPGRHTVSVRATDDEGFVQNAESGSILSGAYPDGTDAIHSVIFVVDD